METFEQLNALCNLLIVVNFIAVILNIINVLLCILKIIDSKKVDEKTYYETDNDCYDKNNTEENSNDILKINDDNSYANTSIEPG